ncbi:MAG: UDP-N-acetylmuramoyl-tripeptide--D-alanyl-D-alanine ligase [Parcubacteria group bacterium LiPW_72]|nr:MAG: UDP-N-acetylmuramoyl-tripeptide--D-alanyl-D-alanine ligase [Parcubacteria group bacterium LiPW_72]
MKVFFQKVLALFARKILKKHRPKIVAVTGSVGKTSAKDAIYTVLAAAFPGRVRKSAENYNNELGVPFAIIGVKAPARNIGAWFNVLGQALRLVLSKTKSYPEILVLEMAADRPGDIGYLVNIARPDVAVVTAVGPSHLEFFASLEAIRDEKEKLVKGVAADGLVVLNRDDLRVAEMKGRSPILKYGLLKDEERPLREEIVASDIRVISNQGGLGFKLNYKGNSVPVHLPKVLGRHQIYAALAAAAAGIHFKMNLIKISESLKHFQTPPGRMRMLPGIKNSLIIDDTYNAAPVSTIAALRTLAEVAPAGRRRVAILGDMLELGAETEKGHREVGRVARSMADLLITVGDRANFASDEARRAGMSEERIIEYNYTDEVLEDIENILKPNDVILVKGSQAMRMEKIVKDIMLEPLRAVELLVRQNEEWQKR